jgi:hypothetical protein
VKPARYIVLILILCGLAAGTVSTYGPGAKRATEFAEQCKPDVEPDDDCDPDADQQDDLQPCTHEVDGNASVLQALKVRYGIPDGFIISLYAPNITLPPKIAA